MAIGTTVYAICNYTTGEAYIGESRGVAARWRTHRGLLCRGKHTNAALQVAWDRDGGESFGLAILERISCETLHGPTVTWAEAQERRWLARARAAGIVLYNDQVRRRRVA